MPVETINMGGTPAGQPALSLHPHRLGRPAIGKVRFLAVRAAHNGKDLLFQLECGTRARDVDYSGRGFPDGAGVLFPLNGDAPLATMGSESRPLTPGSGGPT